ncbi:hypothetical protein GGR56DRAFT_133374 [Xylariaceae sp. FL0804]|nr:hypothetical protein GGR56DRAFT_133374 [Xylariaceae sp. FL0804]
MSAKPVLIIGAGVVGLTLAQGLKKAGIPFEVLERDHHISARGQGWAITLHWVLPFLQEMLSPAALDGVESVQVDPEVGRNDTGNFLFINLETLEAKFRIPPNRRRRVNREKLRSVILQDVQDHVHWGKRLVDIKPTTDGVVAIFEDGTTAEGAVLIGAEGSNSRTRKFLAPDTYRNTQLPVRFVGASVDFTPAQVKPLRDIDPLLFQGCHPGSGNFLWISMLETPATNGTADTGSEHYRVQINISWPVKTPADEVEAGDAERLAQMKRRAADFHPLLRDAVHAIPDGSEILEIVLQDWPCLDWDNYDGRVTLAGDAAHAMTMYRGEAANHGILDGFRLCKALENTYIHGRGLKEEVDGYERELRERTSTAVVLSRQACLDAHDYAGLNENSAVLKRRAIAGL